MLDPNVRCVVYSSTPWSIRPSLWLTENMRWMIQNNTDTEKCARAAASINRLCLTAGW